MTEVWKYAFRLKAEERRGWKKLGLKRSESVADHSFAVALLALFEGERRKYNLGRVLKLALIHDWEEAMTGDLTPNDKRRLGSARVRRDRELAIQRLSKILPAKTRTGFISTWTDLKVSRTREARLVHELDKLEMALQAREYEKKVGRGLVADFYKTAAKEVKDDLLRLVLKSATV